MKNAVNTRTTQQPKNQNLLNEIEGDLNEENMNEEEFEELQLMEVVGSSDEEKEKNLPKSANYFL